MTPQPPHPMAKPAFPGARILIVDDERAMRHTLADFLKRMGYWSAEASSGQEALDQIARESFDLVILDLKMPGMDGIEVLQAARPRAPDTVFIILTAYGSLDSAIGAIRLGAFDYLLKPSPVKEIVRAVEAGLVERRRRLSQQDPIALLEQALISLKTAEPQPETPPSTERFLQAEDITVDTDRQLAVLRDQPVSLSPTEFDLLAYLMRQRDRVVSCRELVAHIRGYDLDEREARILLRSHIHRLRRKLEPDPAQPRFIRTARGRGYIFATEPEPPTAPPS